MGLFKRSLQFVELESGERRPVPTVFLLGVLVVGQFAVSVWRVRTRRRFGRAAGATSTCAHREEREKLGDATRVILLLFQRESWVNWRCVLKSDPGMWRKLTVETFWGVTLLHRGHNYIPVVLSRDFTCQTVGGWFLEDGVLLKSQYRLYAVDGGRVVPGNLDGAHGGRQALLRHHHLGSWSKKPHLSAKIRQNTHTKKKRKIVTTF